MGTKVTIKIGGEAGQGIQTIGALLSAVCRRNGLFIFAVNHFESRIRGGSSFNILRISDEPLAAPAYRADILVAINRHIHEREKESLLEDAIVLLNTDETEVAAENVFPIDFEGIAKDAGGKIASNTVAAGTLLGLLNAPFESLSHVLENFFGKKGKKVLDLNKKAAEKGFRAADPISFAKSFDFQPTHKERVQMSGSQAAALGALASNCRFFSFYPMSPATDIFSHAATYGEDLPVMVEQAEGEIAAVNMAIGASFAGVRSLTATSGGGFCLMTEGLGLAAMTETPLVVINAQRPGPATGLPTRTAQGDLLFTVHASQDEFPRFVFAPGTIQETFETMKKAYQLTERYQVPAIILMDQFLCDSIVTEEGRFAFNTKEDPPSSEYRDEEKETAYLRHTFSEDGISPRVLPCVSEALVRTTANEHDPAGSISEDAENRIRMVDKRHKKVDAMLREMEKPWVFEPECTYVLTGWGSSKGSIKEAAEILHEEGYDVGALVFKDIWPMDEQVVSKIIADKKLIMVEQNATCQLGRLIRQQAGAGWFDAVLKYDGRPLFPAYIVERARKIMEQ